MIKLFGNKVEFQPVTVVKSQSDLIKEAANLIKRKELLQKYLCSKEDMFICTKAKYPLYPYTTRDFIYEFSLTNYEFEKILKSMILEIDAKLKNMGIE